MSKIVTVILRFLFGALFTLPGLMKNSSTSWVKIRVHNVLMSVPALRTLGQRLKRYYNTSVFLHFCSAV
jgi:hypothetical protein